MSVTINISVPASMQCTDSYILNYSRPGCKELSYPLSCSAVIVLPLSYRGRYLNYTAWFLKNTSTFNTKEEIMKQKPFYGILNTDYAARLKNATFTI
jgi:hypothetical protein